MSLTTFSISGFVGADQVRVSGAKPDLTDAQLDKLVAALKAARDD